MTEEEAMLRGWKRERCFACHGTGQVSDYGLGEDFYGPKECDQCGGGGSYWLTPNGTHALWPGGPFC